MNRFKNSLDPILNDNTSPQVDDLQDEFTAIVCFARETRLCS